MRLGAKGLEMIHHFESCKLTSYRDSVGIWTIGWGNTMYENGISVKQGETITQARANELFAAIAARFESGVTKRVKQTLTQNQFDALVSFCYNCGFGNFDKSTLLKKVNVNPNDASIRGEFMKWNKAGGHELNGLTRRRKAEADLYFAV